MAKIIYLVIASIAAFMIFLLCVGFGYGLNKHPCPHDAFVRKHLCQDCRTPGDALEYSHSRLAQGIHINTVLFGDPNFELIEDQFCQNIERLVTYNCDLARNISYHQGSCKAKHHTTTGHLFYREMDCV